VRRRTHELGQHATRRRLHRALRRVRAHRGEGGLQRAQLKELADVAVHGLAVGPHPISPAMDEFLQRHQHRGLHPRVREVAARAVDRDREARLCGDERRQFRQEGGRVAAQALGEARGGVGGCLGHPLQA